MKYVIAHDISTAHDYARQLKLRPGEWKAVLPHNWSSLLRGVQIEVEDVIWAPAGPVHVGTARFSPELWTTLRIVTHKSRARNDETKS